MSVAKTPKLLFHGTAAVSAYISYQVGQDLLQHNQRAALKLIGPNKVARKNFKNLGPAYPCTGTATYNQEICLTTRIVDAFNFAEYDCRIVDVGSFQLNNQKGCRIHLSTINYLQFPAAQRFLFEFTQAMLEQGFREFSTPGAVLMVDGPMLTQAGLMIHGTERNFYQSWSGRQFGEEDFRARYLPWDFIRGALFTYPRPFRITAFWFRDDQIQADLNEYLDTTPLDPYRLFRQNAMTTNCLEAMSKENTPWQEWLDQ